MNNQLFPTRDSAVFGSLFKTASSNPVVAEQKVQFERYSGDQQDVEDVICGSRTLKAPASFVSPLKEHLDMCCSQGVTLQARDVENAGWLICGVSGESTQQLAVDLAMQPPDEWLAPSKARGPVDEKLISLIHRDCSHRIHQNLERECPSYSPEEIQKLKKVTDFILDRRKIIPTLSRVGRRLRERYFKKHGKELPHSLVQFGEDVPVSYRHNYDKCKEMGKRYPEEIGTTADFLRVQQLNCNADFQSLLAQDLPDVEELLRETILDYLKELGMDVKAPMFAGFVRGDVADPIVMYDFFQEAPGSGNVDHGVHSHLLQIIALLENKLIDKELLNSLIKKHGWNYVLDVFTTSFSEVIRLADKDKRQFWFFFNYMTTATSYPQSLYRSMTTGADSGSIKTVLAEGSRERIRRLVVVVSGKTQSEIDGMTDSEIKELLEEAGRNLRALEVASVDSAYKAMDAISKLGGESIERYFKGSRKFDVTWKTTAVARHYASKGWHVYKMTNDSDYLEQVTFGGTKANKYLGDTGAYVLYPPGSSQPPMDGPWDVVRLFHYSGIFN